MTIDNKIKLVGCNRNDCIDYLKGIAMIMVILLHSIQMVNGLPEVIRKPILLGQIGVQLFFFCSGYLVMKPYSENKKTLDLHKSICFLIKKYIGLMIPFVSFMAIYLIINYLYTVLQIDLPYINNTDIIAIVVNALLLHGFFPFCLNNVVPGGWYVGTLLILFAVTPFIIVRIKTAKHMMVLSAFTALISIVFSVILHYFFAGDTSNGSYFYFSFLNQSPAYLMGMSLAIGEPKTKVLLKNYLFKDGAIMLIIVALFYFEFFFSYAIIPFLSALMYVDIYRILSSCPVLIKKTKWICNVGQNTFAIYLSHFLVVWYIPLFIQNYLHISGVFLWIIILCLCVMLCFSSPCISKALNKLSKLIKRACN